MTDERAKHDVRDGAAEERDAQGEQPSAGGFATHADALAALVATMATPEGRAAAAAAREAHAEAEAERERRREEHAAAQRAAWLAEERARLEAAAARVSTCACGASYRGASTCCPTCADVAERRRRERASTMVRLHVIPPRFRWATLDAAELAERVPHPRAIELARRSLGARVVVFCGPVGAGKSSLASAWLAAWIAARVAEDEQQSAHRAVWASAFDIASARALHPLGKGEPELVANAITAPVLLLDDLLSEPNDPRSTIADVVHGRHDAQRPIVVTTWGEEHDVATRYGAGVARRLYEGARIVRLGPAQLHAVSSSPRGSR